MPETATEDQNTDAPLMVTVSGCRGITGVSFTPLTISRYCAAWAADVRAHQKTDRPTIVVGRDGRAGGSVLQRMAESALNSAGCDTIGLGTAMTPTVGLMVRELGADAGLVLTASHNPAEWNGLKPITELGAAPTSQRVSRLLEGFHNHPPAWSAWDRLGTHTEHSGATALHVRRVLDAIARVCDPVAIRRRGFKVLADSVNASGVEGCRELLHALGCDLTHINSDDSGLFPHPPEPTREHLKDLAVLMADSGADIAFAQDTDADRLAILGPGGVYIGEEYTLVLCVMSLLESMGDKAKGAVLCANLSTSRMIDDVAARYGATVLRTPVGEANVSSAMGAEGAVLGGEGNGGVIWPDVVMIRDSLGSMALVLALLARTGRTLDDLVADVPAYTILKTKAPITEALRSDAPALLKAEFEGASVDEQDGVRLDFETDSGRGWLHARPSNTEPIYRLIAEAPNEHEAGAIIQRAQKSLGTP